jgi:hypothetical protein
MRQEFTSMSRGYATGLMLGTSRPRLAQVRRDPMPQGKHAIRGDGFTTATAKELT